MLRSPIFILGPMRSYTSMTCGMLGQHPQLYGLPEVNLFMADQVGELLDLAKAVRPAGLHGLLRTIAQLETGAQSADGIDRARQWLQVRRNWTTQRLFHWIMEAIAPRVCVEKSPSTVMKAHCLKRLIGMFPDALVIHLTRHPRPTCRSIHQLMAGNDQRIGLRRTEKTDFEGMWLTAHRNILQLAGELGMGQYIRLKGEDFLSDPAHYLPQIAEWLDVGTTREELEAMRHPEASPYACIGPQTARFGNDPGFLKNPRFEQRLIEESRLDGPLEWLANRMAPAYFSDETKRLAQRFGYH